MKSRIVYLNGTEKTVDNEIIQTEKGFIARLKKEFAEGAELMKYSLIIISTLPMLILYPFLQKFFEKGVMMGSIKG